MSALETNRCRTMKLLGYLSLMTLACIPYVACDCGAPSSPPHSSPNITGYTEGSVVIHTCVDGYKMDVPGFQLEQNQTCFNGSWEGPTPTCVDISCDNPGMVVNSTHSPAGAVGYLDQVTYHCIEGHRTPAGARTTYLTCQADQTWNKAKPSCQPVTCPTPETVPSATRTQATVFYYLDEVTYTCEPGYELTAGDATLVCDGQRSWNGTWPQCTRRDCGDPGVLHNAARILSGTLYEHTVEYTCMDGYERDMSGGDLTRTCNQTGHWSGLQPACIGHYCGPPSAEPTHAVRVPSSPSHRYPEVLSYTCDTGYRADYSSGLSETQCRKDRTWSFALMECTRVHCPETNRSVNAKEDPGTFYYGDTKHYECLVGYALDSGDLNRTCQANGTFSGSVPVCTAIQCPALTTPAYADRTGSTQNYRDVVVFECQAGFQVAGEVNVFKRALICQSNQQWSGVEPVCEPLSCGRPSYGSHTEHVSGDGEAYGDTVVLRCEAGYELSSGDLSRTCQANRTWSGTAPVCSPIQCGLPPSRDNVVRHGQTFQYPARVYYECAKGYKKVPGVGGEFYECGIDGNWGGGDGAGMPTCEPVPCYQPETIRGAQLLSSASDTYLYGEAITYECQEGHVHSNSSGSLTRTCNYTRHWSGERPVCERVSCGDPGDRPGAYKIGFSFRYTDVVNYTCKAGYEVQRGIAWSTLTCLANGTWQGQLPDCRRVFCGDPGVSEFSTRVVQGLHYGDKIVYKCAEGYRVPDGIYQLECIEDGTWTFPTPQCVPVENINLTAPVDGTPIDAVDSEEGILIGKICIIVMSIEFGLIVLLDVTTIWKDIRVMIRNIKHGVRRMKGHVHGKDDRVSPLPLPEHAQ